MRNADTGGRVEKKISRIFTLLLIVSLAFVVGIPQARAELDIAAIREAAEQGDVDAQYALGVAYSEGEQFSRNDINAYAWSSLAAAQGLRAAIVRRDAVSRNFSPKELKKAQALAAEFQARVAEQIKPSPSLRFQFLAQPLGASKADVRSWLQNIKPAAGGE